MSQISKCPKVTVVLTYWEASVEVSELSYKSLLYSTSVGSYCIIGIKMLFLVPKGILGTLSKFVGTINNDGPP